MKYKGAVGIRPDVPIEENDTAKLTKSPPEVIAKPKRNLVFILAIILLIIAIIVFPKIFKRNTLETLRSAR